MKKLITTLAVLMTLACSATVAQNPSQVSEMPKYWTVSGSMGLNISQTSFKNWSAGGDSAVSLDLFYNYSADYKRDKHLWLNRLELAYGFADTKSTGTRKTNDKIFLSSSYGCEVAKNLYASAMMTFSTQFAKGFDYPTSTTDYISRFMAPGYLSTGLGVIWTPKTWFTLSVSPSTYRITFVNDTKLSDLGSFGVSPGRKIRHEFGAAVRAEIQYEVMKNIMFYSRLDLFSNYLEKPQNVDVSWDLQLNMRVNKWVSANFTLNLLYDDDIRTADRGARLQVREMLGVGVQMNF